MAELKLSDEEKHSETLLTWSDETLGKAVKAAAFVLDDKHGKDAVIWTTAACLIIKKMRAAGSESTSITLDGVTLSEEVGNWKVTIEQMLQEADPSGETMKTIKFCDIEMKVIADLGGGFVLAAHKNGPVIATEHSIATLAFCGFEPAFKPNEEDEDDGLPVLEDDGLPFDVRYRALSEYVDWSWRVAKHQLDDPGQPGSVYA